MTTRAGWRMCGSDRFCVIGKPTWARHARDARGNPWPDPRWPPENASGWNTNQVSPPEHTNLAFEKLNAITRKIGVTRSALRKRDQARLRELQPVCDLKLRACRARAPHAF